MKIVKPSVSFLWGTLEPVKTIERAGRVAYKSEDKMTETSAEAFVRKIIAMGHEAVIEHASASLLFVCDRGVTHEIVRHRLFSYVQESTRYCNYTKEKFGSEISVIKPPLTAEQEPLWIMAVSHAEAAYNNMIAAGASPQIARSVLPTCLKTEIVVTGNMREWRHFFKLRTSPKAHPQMIEVAKMAFDILSEWSPVVFEDLKHKEVVNQ